jgi:hypothetical protein
MSGAIPLHHPDHTLDVDVEHAADCLDVDLFDGATKGIARIVDQDVEPPVPLEHGPNRRLDRRLVGDVERERHRHAAAIELSRPAGRRDRPVARSGERRRRRQADSCTATTHRRT